MPSIRFKSGDIVQVTNDKEEMKRLQTSCGGFSPKLMNDLLGKKVKVTYSTTKYVKIQYNHQIYDIHQDLIYHCEIFEVVSRNDPKQLRLVLNPNNINSRDDQGRTPMLVTCSKQDANPEILRELIDCGADISLVDNQGNCPITLCCRHGKLQFLEILLSKLAKDSNHSNQEGFNQTNSRQIMCLSHQHGSNPCDLYHWIDLTTLHQHTSVIEFLRTYLHQNTCPSSTALFSVSSVSNSNGFHLNIPSDSTTVSSNNHILYISETPLSLINSVSNGHNSTRRYSRIPTETIDQSIISFSSSNSPRDNLSLNSDIILCRICMNYPRIIRLDCGHTICLSCSKRSLLCPFCKQDITTKINLFT